MRRRATQTTPFPQMVIAEGIQKASRAFRFSLREPRAAVLLVRMAGWVAAVSVLVKFLPLPRVMKFTRPLRRRAPAGPAEPLQAEHARLLDRLLNTNFLFLTPTCWKRAPVLYRFLALRGIETRVVFGVRKGAGDSMDGHAWLEAGGRAVLERDTPDYKITYTYPD
jgi:Transglutaminase-like superfamily